MKKRSVFVRYIPPIAAEEVHRLLSFVIESARRHCCQVCHRVFECHLCTIDRDAPRHDGHVTPFPRVLCEECAIALGLENSQGQKLGGYSGWGQFWRYRQRLERWHKGLLLRDLSTGKDCRRPRSRPLGSQSGKRPADGLSGSGENHERNSGAS